MRAKLLASGCILALGVTFNAGHAAAEGAVQVGYSEVDQTVVGGHAGYLGLTPSEMVAGSVEVHHFLLGVSQKLKQPTGGCNMGLADAIGPASPASSVRTVVARPRAESLRLVATYYCISDPQAVRVSTTLLVFLAGINASQNKVPITPKALPELTVDALDPTQQPERSNEVPEVRGYAFDRVPLEAMQGKTGPVGIGDGRVWAAFRHSSGPRHLAEIDPSTNEVVGIVDVGARTGSFIPTAPLVVGNTVWVGETPGCSPCEINVVQSRSLDLVGRVSLPGPASSLIHAFGYVWAAGDNDLYAIDPVSRRVVGVVEATRAQPPIASNGRIWFVDSGTGALRAIDPATRDEVWSVSIGAGVGHNAGTTIVAAGGRVWARLGSTLHAVDAATGAHVGQHDFGTANLFDPSVVNGQIWVPNMAASAITVFDAAHFSEVRTISTQRNPVWARLLHGKVLTGHFGPRTLTAIDPDTGAVLGQLDPLINHNSLATVAFNRLWFADVDGHVIVIAPPA